jgi:hypothetical protein
VRVTLLLAAAVVLGGSVSAQAGRMHAVVADLPYARVWDAALKAVEGYPIERVAYGLIVTGRVERPPRPDEAGVDRVAERVTVRLEARADRITRVTVEVTAEGWQDGAWVPIPNTDVTAREILRRLAAAEG